MSTLHSRYTVVNCMYMYALAVAMLGTTDCNKNMYMYMYMYILHFRLGLSAVSSYSMFVIKFKGPAFVICWYIDSNASNDFISHAKHNTMNNYITGKYAMKQQIWSK